MKTYSMKASEVEKKWLVIDATDVVLGRLAAKVAMILSGKDKPSYTPSQDCGDNVIIINADKIHLSGHKSALKDGKFYYRHTGYFGGIKETTAGKILAGKNPQRVVEKAVERMLAKGPMGRQRLSNLYVYAGSSHPHEAQKPSVLDFASMSSKNKKG
ncbi:MAG: 50S ribosomal protein L13 [Rickettsiales bacterium]|jgi:large subunit ribosomal protein L13|nr:50S ribosomal protein L13 [Rickettsiales bacterium]